MTLTLRTSQLGQDTTSLSSHAASLFNQFFDGAWYLETYPDVKNYPGTPRQHYLSHGYAERRSPHPLFDLSWYLQHHPEVAESGVEPLSYYLETGWRQLHSPHPLFVPGWYLLNNMDLVVAGIDPFRHYLEQGWVEGRQLHPLFDTQWYLEAYSDVASTNRDPLSHFLTTGWKEGRCPHPLFHTGWYLDQYPDIAKTGLNPWLHYINTGWYEGYSPNARFDARWYLRTYLDQPSRNCEPLAHYLDTGWREGLLPAEDARSDLGKNDKVAPLYSQIREELAASLYPSSTDLRNTGSRGTVILVVHETEIGGAPHVLNQFAQWLRDRTRFGIRIVAMRGGNLRHAFGDVAPLLVLSDHPEGQRTDVLKDWMGTDVRGCFLNSVASGNFLKYMPSGLPTVAFIHELPQVLDLFPEELNLIREHVPRVIGGGPEVTRVLRDQYEFASDKLVSAVSFVEDLPKDTDFDTRRSNARIALGLPSERIVVMGCGLLHWRKAPDKFVETAELVLDAGIDADFVWLGGGADLEACEKLVVEKGLEDRIRFTGYEPDVAGKLAAADIFVLSSQEDPFPLVALYAAQAGLPIVCFRDAGGIEGFVASGSGTAVPFMDVAAMANAVKAYARDPQLRTNDGNIGRLQVERTHIINIVGPLLLHHFREVMGIPPEVSVVVPNYNYESYLPERLDSIAAQTFQDFEVILLDDASPDGSVSLLEDFAARRPGTQVVVNQKNSGSPFIQWIKGMDLAQSDLVWLAEADDRCRPEFLQTLLPIFDDRNIRIASCASQPITAGGEVIGDYRPLYLDRITHGRWDHDYVATDHEEANAGLGIANSIPNASAVMFRKFLPDPEFARQVTEMRLCGDWYFYVRAMRGGFVGFSAKLLNDHRRHGNTVTHKLEGSLRYFNELATVREYLGRTYRQDSAAQSRIAEFLAQDIARFNVEEPEKLPTVTASAKALPTLLMVAPDLSPGGGQVFAISVANEWNRRGGRVVLLNVANQPSHPAMLARISPEVILLEAGQPGTDLATLIERFDIDAVHSGIWWADRWVDDQREALPDTMPWVVTMHGCHETFLENPNIDNSFPDRIRRMCNRASWAYIADKNLSVFEIYGFPKQITKIPNGIREAQFDTPLKREDIGLRSNSTVLCLASRAIPEKGWVEAVRLTQRLNAEGHIVDLLLIGEGPAERSLSAQNPANVHFTGQVTDPQAYFELADIGLLPSYFVGESLPLTLLEMMANGLPIIGTRIGEIPQIIGEGKNTAGLIVPLREDGVDENVLHAAVIKLLSPRQRLKMGKSARKRFETDFTIRGMLERYEILYHSEGTVRHE